MLIPILFLAVALPLIPPNSPHLMHKFQVLLSCIIYIYYETLQQPSATFIDSARRQENKL